MGRNMIELQATKEREAGSAVNTPTPLTLPLSKQEGTLMGTLSHTQPHCHYSHSQFATEDRCECCGAVNHRMGAHDTEGRWWSLLAIMDAYGGFAFDTTTPVYIARFGTDQEPPLTELVNGRCQHCREGGAR